MWSVYCGVVFAYVGLILCLCLCVHVNATSRMIYDCGVSERLRLVRFQPLRVLCFCGLVALRYAMSHSFYSDDVPPCLSGVRVCVRVCVRAM